MKCPINKQFGIDYNKDERCNSDICDDKTYEKCLSLNSLRNDKKAMKAISVLKKLGYSANDVCNAWRKIVQNKDYIFEVKDGNNKIF